MNDFISPVLKLLSTLVSIRAAVRYVFIGVSLAYSWVKIKPIIDPYGLPSQISGTACTFIGVGVGAIAAWVIFFIIDSLTLLYKGWQEKKHIKEEEKKEASKQLEQESKFIETFASNIMHYNSHSLKILRYLCKSDKSFTTDPQGASVWEIKAIEGLSKNSIILKVMNIDAKTNVYRVNPLLKDWLANYFYEKSKSQCIEFIENISPSRAEALRLLEENDSDIKIAEFPHGLMTSNYHYSPCIECNATDDFEQSFCFEFREDYKEIFEEVMGKKYRDYIEVKATI